MSTLPKNVVEISPEEIREGDWVSFSIFTNKNINSDLEGKAFRITFVYTEGYTFNTPTRCINGFLDSFPQYKKFYREDGPACEYANGDKPTASTTENHCPLCGNSGDDLIFNFYCSNKSCSNYKG